MPLDGYKTYLAALGLFGLALYQLSQGEIEAGVKTATQALAILGLRRAIASS